MFEAAGYEAFNKKQEVHKSVPVGKALAGVLDNALKMPRLRSVIKAHISEFLDCGKDFSDT